MVVSRPRTLRGLLELIATALTIVVLVWTAALGAARVMGVRVVTTAVEVAALQEQAAKQAVRNAQMDQSRDTLRAWITDTRTDVNGLTAQVGILVNEVRSLVTLECVQANRRDLQLAGTRCP